MNSEFLKQVELIVAITGAHSADTVARMAQDAGECALASTLFRTARRQARQDFDTDPGAYANWYQYVADLAGAWARRADEHKNLPLA